MTDKPAPGVIVAGEDQANGCCACGCRIDRGDHFRVDAWPNGNGFDYRHDDCSDTRMLDHVRGKA